MNVKSMHVVLVKLYHQSKDAVTGSHVGQNMLPWSKDTDKNEMKNEIKTEMKSVFPSLPMRLHSRFSVVHTC